MNKMHGWIHKGDEPKAPILYRGCGLDDIYLLSGYELKETPNGPAMMVKDLDGLHAAIGAHLVNRRKLLAGKEIRFLRKQMDLTQSELARLIGCDAQSVARYEKDKTSLPGPHDRLLRMLYKHASEGRVNVRDVLEALEELDDLRTTDAVFMSTDEGWRAAAAA